MDFFHIYTHAAQEYSQFILLELRVVFTSLITYCIIGGFSSCVVCARVGQEFVVVDFATNFFLLALSVSLAKFVEIFLAISLELVALPVVFL